jgi:hypothetical protein
VREALKKKRGRPSKRDIEIRRAIEIQEKNKRKVAQVVSSSHHSSSQSSSYQSEESSSEDDDGNDSLSIDHSNANFSQLA